MGRRLALTVIIAASLAGCGTSTSVSPSSYRTRVLAVCGRYSTAVKAEERRQERAAVATPTKPVRTAGAARLLRRMIGDIRTIPPPSSTSGLVARWLRAGSEVAAILDREDGILSRDSRLVARDLRRLKLPHRKLTAEELKHPTAAIIDEIAARSPAWRKFMRDAAAIERQSLGPTRTFETLAAKLRVRACLG